MLGVLRGFNQSQGWVLLFLLHRAGVEEAANPSTPPDTNRHYRAAGAGEILRRYASELNWNSVSRFLEAVYRRKLWIMEWC